MEDSDDENDAISTTADAGSSESDNISDSETDSDESGDSDETVIVYVPPKKKESSSAPPSGGLFGNTASAPVSTTGFG